MSRMRAACRRKTRSLFENKESQKICGFSGFQFSRKVTERAHPAPLRGAAAAAAEGPINRRCAKNAFSEAASIFPLRLLPWGLKGACSPFLVAGWVESRGREGGVETPLPASGPAERPGALSKRHSLSPRKALYTTKNAPKHFRFEAFELELLSRFELETSSLPRMRSTN